MLLSIAILLILATLFGEVASRLGLPSLVGMIVAGMVLGPYGCDLLSDGFLDVSSEMRTFALVVILMRVGLSLDLDLLRQSGRTTALLSFFPAVMEILGMIIIAPLLLDISVIDAAIMGAVVSAVSPAIVVPRMIELKERPEGRKVAQVIMAAASIDDLFVILLFSIFMQMGAGGEFEPSLLLNLPVSLVSGVVMGVVIGYLLSVLFVKYHLRDTIKVTLLLSVSMLLMGLEPAITSVVPYSPLLSLLTIGAVLGRRNREQTARVSEKCGKVWQVAQLLLFSLVGAAVDLSYAWEHGAIVVVVLVAVLLWRVMGVWLSTHKSNFTQRERFFTMIAYTPKATVQAAIGSVPLAMGMECGELILSIAVVSILVTAPLGAFGIDWASKRLL